MITMPTGLNIALFVLAAVILRKVTMKSAGRLPPGPRGLPILENLFDMPNGREWLTFTKWGKQFGDITSVSVFGQKIIILNSAKIAVEMLEKKSAKYSDRPVMQMGGELVGWKDTLVLLPYGERFRNYRKYFHQIIGSHAAASAYHPIEEVENHRFLKRVLAQPDDLAVHIRKTAGAIILRISHGYGVKEKDDPFVTLADEAVEQFSLSTAPGVFLVNLVPALRYIPTWFPGSGFKKVAAEWRETLARMADAPHQYVKQQMSLGVAEPSFTSRLLQRSSLSSDEEHEIKWSAASLYSGGADTTVGAIYAFFLSMALHPEVAKTAQRELDDLIGGARLPGFADKESLPYINALTLEVLRWHVVTPIGFPHRVTEDDIHDGYMIPKGSLVMPNVWQMLHDPNVYSDPFAFKPERFLGPNPEEDPRNVCFGFGRRICPGRLLAGDSIFITIAMSLAVFDITKLSKNGVESELAHEQAIGTISHPKPFQCSIKSRSGSAASLIAAEEASLGH